jgi:alcohol dehydrogenase class IV
MNASFAPITLLTPPRVEFGAGCATRTIGAVARGRTRALVIATAAVRSHADSLGQALRSMGLSVELFEEPPTEPTVASCDDLLHRTRAFAPDLVVGVGGGSILDAAKLAAALHPCDKPVSHFFGSGLVPPRQTGLVCIPTTAGTGSEASPNALLLDESANAKKAVISPTLVPDAAIVDPTLMLTLPAAITATTGIDALAHCLEAYASLVAHPVIDLYALEGVRLIGAHLPRAVADGNDLAAREAVALGSFYGGLCLGPVNTNGVHALAYPLGGELHLPHALSIALMLPHVVAFNCAALPARHAALARALGSEISANDELAAKSLPERLHTLLAACRLTMGLSNHGVPRDALPRLAEAGLQVTRLLKANPRPISRADAISIYEAAF